MHRMLGRIDYFVSQSANAFHRRSFRADRIAQSLFSFGRMRPSRLAETARKYFVSSFKKQNRHRQSSLAETAQLPRTIIQELPFPNADYQSRALDSAAIFFARVYQPSERRQQGQRHVIDTEVAQIFKCIRR